jgi:hypothetical protein
MLITQSSPSTSGRVFFKNTIQLGGRLKKAFGVELEALKLSADNTITDIAKLVHKLQVRVRVCVF